MDQCQSPPITYDEPPLVEVALSVQFDPPRGLNQAHLGAFWAKIRSDLPVVRSTQPIVTPQEVFGIQEQWLPTSIQLALTNEPESRLQMSSSDDQWMCQIQRDRLVVNWRKRQNYPHFSATWDRFLDLWNRWQGFMLELKFKPLKLRLWEVTYVNRIPKGQLWESLSDWPNIFPGLWGGTFATIEGAGLQSFRGQWVWELYQPAAKLYVEPTPGRTGEPILLLSLTARGPINIPENEGQISEGAGLEAIKAGINCGHFLIVNTFDKISGNVAKKIWRRHDNPD